MTTYLTIDVEASAGLPAAGAGKPSPENLRLLLRFLKGFPEARGGTIRATIPGAKASGTFTCASVADGNTASVNGVTMTASQLHATGTVTPSNPSAGDTVTLQGVVFTAVGSSPGTNEFLQTGDNAADAAALATAINASPTTDISSLGLKITSNPTVEDEDSLLFNNKRFYFVEQAASHDEVTIGIDAEATAVNLAEALNRYGHATVDCTEVAAGDAVTVDGVRFQASDTPDASGYQFSSSGTPAAIAWSLASAVRARLGYLEATAYGEAVIIKRQTGLEPLVVSATIGGLTSAAEGMGPSVSARSVGAYVLFTTWEGMAPALSTGESEGFAPCGFTATSAGAVVTVRARLAGDTNASLESSNGTRLALSDSVLSGGATPEDGEFSSAGGNADVASDLRRALLYSVDPLVLRQVDVTSMLGVVTVTAKSAGALGNAVTLAGTGNVTASAARLEGGENNEVITMTF